MLVVIVSVALLALAVVLCVVWGRERLVEPALPAPASDAARSASAPTAPRLRRHLDGLRLYAWWVSMFLVAATASTLLVTGAGGRLAMRLLALTSPEATGRLTEAAARVADVVETQENFRRRGALGGEGGRADGKCGGENRGAERGFERHEVRLAYAPILRQNLTEP